jgi:hypothetical protein
MGHNRIEEINLCSIYHQIRGYMAFRETDRADNAKLILTALIVDTNLYVYSHQEPENRPLLVCIVHIEKLVD